ncbi:MAG: hypothetical protein HN348_25615, partial [Proteobacteria bacterium]|nr:hypothetical protein [Pseudomonadota bacterium]
ELERLEDLRTRQLEEVERRFANLPRRKNEKERDIRRIGRIFDSYLDWVQESMTTEPAPFLQVIAVLRAESGFGGAA